MRAVALKQLPLTPTEFWHLTPAELSEMIEGAQWRRYQQWEIAAWVTAHMINVSGKVSKKQVKPAQLLGKKPPKTGGKHLAFQELIRRQEAINAKDAN